MNPTRRSVWLIGAGFPLSLAPAVVDDRLTMLWLAVIGASLLLILLDALLLLPRRSVQVSVDVPPEVFLGAPSACTLRISIRGRGTSFTVVCDLDPHLAAQPPQTVVIAKDGEATVQIALEPSRRGTFAIQSLWLRWDGPMQLVARTWQQAIDLQVVVSPDLRATRAVALRFFGSHAPTMGLKVERFAGDGTEFESLRTWTPGLDPRGVDWKATARHRRLLCRRFRAERNHQVIVAVDCGHLMSEPLDGVPRLDRAIERALALSWLCLRTGDRVGLYSFDAQPHSYLEPQAGIRAFPLLRRASAAMEYGTAETNFALGLLSLSQRLKRRSLVVVFTEFADSITGQLMIDHVMRLARRHVVLFVALRDPHMEAVLGGEPTRLSDVHRAVVASGLRSDRDAALQRLRRAGVHVVDAVPKAATVQLLKHYLDIKRRELV